MSSPGVDSEFIKQLKIVLEHWQIEAAGQDKAVLDRLDLKRQNLYHIVDLGLDHEYTHTAASQLALAAFPLVEQRGYWSEWIPILERAIHLGGAKPSLLMFQLHNRLGQLYRWQRQIDRAIDVHKTAETIAKKLNEEQYLARAWFNIGEDYKQIQQYDECEKYGLKALEIFNRLNEDSAMLASVHNLLGTNAKDQNRLELAESHLEKAVSLWKKTNNTVMLARTIMNLANTLRSAKQLPEALSYYKEAAGLLSINRWTPEKQLIQISLGGLHYDLDQFSEAEIAYRKALSSEFNQARYTFYEAYAFQGLGNVLLKMGRYEEAEPLLENAITCWQEMKDEVNLANSLGTLAESTAAQQKFEQSVTLYKTAINLVKKHQDIFFAQVLLEEFESQLREIIDGPPESGESDL